MKNIIIRLIVIITIILIILDQISKIVVSNCIETPIGNDYFKIEITSNTGMAFGFNNGNVKNIFITIFVLFIIIKFIKNQLERIDKKTAIAISMVLAGGISNLIDRVFRGSVLDFIKIYKFAIFNFADILIVFRMDTIDNIYNRFFKKIEV